MKPKVVILMIACVVLIAGCGKKDEQPETAGPSRNTDAEAAPPGVSTDLSGGRK